MEPIASSTGGVSEDLDAIRSDDGLEASRDDATKQNWIVRPAECLSARKKSNARSHACHKLGARWYTESTSR